MAAYNFSIRTKLALSAGVGVLLVAGMLVNEQIGNHYAALQRIEADNKQLATVEALRAADDLRQHADPGAGNPSCRRARQSRPRTEAADRLSDGGGGTYRSRHRNLRRRRPTGTDSKPSPA